MKKSKTFAKALKELRKSKNITLEQISNFSKIDQKYFEEFEKGNFSFKDQVYIRLFLIEYVKYIDLEKVDTIIIEFDNLFDSKNSNSNLTFLPSNLDNVEDDGFDSKNIIEIHDKHYTSKKILTIISIFILIIIIYQFVVIYSQ